jgi:hypothetical protein
MAVSFATVVKSYQDELKNGPSVPKGSFGRSVVGNDGFPTRLSFGFLCVPLNYVYCLCVNV